MNYYHTARSPLGELLLISDGESLTGLYFDGHRPRPRLGVKREDPGPFHAAVEQLSEYFAGRRDAFDVPIAAAGTDFQRLVWNGLRGFEFGATRTYADVAREIGRSAAVRAVASAIANNPISIIIPCHRVIGGDGSLRGYAGGLDRKQWLLEHEASRRDGASDCERTSVLTFCR